MQGHVPRYEDCCYDLEAWNDPSRLPVGWAGGLAFAAGIAGCVVGMSERWAEWEERVRDVEILVRRMEAAKKRDEGIA